MKTRKAKTEGKSVLKEKETNTDKWAFILNSGVLQVGDESGKDVSIVALKHPQTGQSSLFLFSANNETVQEVQTFSEDKRCWFFDDTIIGEGKMYLATPVDPLFLALPYLKTATRCSPLDQVIFDGDYPETNRLLKCDGLKYIHRIADRRGNESLNAYIYNEDKTLQWLQKKVERITDSIKSRGINVISNSAISANFVKSSATVESRASYLKYAHGIVSEYLPDDLSRSLAEFLNLPAEPETKLKRKKKDSDVVVVVDDDEGQENKRIKVEESPSEKLKSPKTQQQQDSKWVKVEESPSEKLKSPKKTPKKTPQPEKQALSAKDKARAKAATGSKNISSFFKKL